LLILLKKYWALFVLKKHAVNTLSRCDSTFAEFSFKVEPANAILSVHGTDGGFSL